MPLRAATRDAAIAIAAVLGVNGIVFGLGFSGTTDRAGEMTSVPGWLIGAVWTGLFALFGAAHGLLRALGPRTRTACHRLRWFGAFCLAYPFYTLGLSNQIIGLAGNAVTAIAALAVIRAALRESRLAGALITPVLPWLGFASWLSVYSWRSD